LAEAEAEFAQCRDLRNAGHLIGTIGAPPSRCAGRCDQAALLVEAQSLGGNAEPLGGLGRVQELRGRAHESPRRWLTSILIGAALRVGSSGNLPNSAIFSAIKQASYRWQLLSQSVAWCDAAFWLLSGGSGHRADTPNRSLMTHRVTSRPPVTALRSDYSIARSAMAIGRALRQ